MNRVILSTKLLIGEGQFQAEVITKQQALRWLESGPFANYCGHATVQALGLEPDKSRTTCEYYDEALCLAAKNRLEFGREYTLVEIEAIGVEYVLIRRTVSLDDILQLAAKSPTGLPDVNAPAKLQAEWQELVEAIDQGDYTGSLTEVADIVYYAAKSIHSAATLVHASVTEAMEVAMAKYKLRMSPGNPKDDEAERDAVLEAIRDR